MSTSTSDKFVFVTNITRSRTDSTANDETPANVDLITIGQYLAPSEKHLKIDRFPEPEMYDIWAQQAISLGYSGVASGPLVRSSFKAGLLYRKTKDSDNDDQLPGAYVMVQPSENVSRDSINPASREVKQ